MEKEDFVTPPDHVAFLAKKLFGPCGEIIDGAVAYLEPCGGGPAQPHTHAHDHLFIVLSGQARISMDGVEKLLNPDEAFLVPGDVPHAVWNNVQTMTVMIGISVKRK